MNNLPTLPGSITVEVNGSPLTLTGQPNKAQTRVWYNESGLVPEIVDPELVPTALGAITVVYDGTALNAGEVHKSEPRKYNAKHAKAGQTVPGTGGNQTVTHSLAIVLLDADEAEYRFTLMVTVTFIDGKGFRINAKAIPAAESTTKVIEGVSFAA